MITNHERKGLRVAGAVLLIGCLAAGAVLLIGCLAAGAAWAGEFYPLTGGDQDGNYASGGNEKYSLLDAPGGDPGLPVAFALHMRSSNPLRGSALFEFALPRAAELSVRVFDVQGREALRVAEWQQFEAGTHRLEISMRGFASAPYWCRLTFRDHASRQVFHEEVKKILRLE